MKMNAWEWIVAKVQQSSVEGIFKDKWGNLNMDQIANDIKK